MHGYTKLFIQKPILVEKAQNNQKIMIHVVLTFLPKNTQRARKFKKGQAEKLMKSNISKKFFREIEFLAVFNFSAVKKK